MEGMQRFTGSGLQNEEGDLVLGIALEKKLNFLHH